MPMNLQVWEEKLQTKLGGLQFVTSLFLSSLALQGNAEELRAQIEACGLGRHYAILDSGLRILAPPNVSLSGNGEFQRRFQRANKKEVYSLYPIAEIREILIGYEDLATDSSPHVLDPNLKIGATIESQRELIPDSLIGQRVVLSRFDNRSFLCESIIRLPGEARVIVAESPTPLVVFAAEGYHPASCGAIVEPKRQVPIIRPAEATA